jgi:hypothetical protein
MSDELTPITREEHFLAKAGGQDVEVPTPITRRETFLQGVIDAIGSGGGGGGGGVLVVTATMGSGGVTLDKTWAEINNADYPIIKFLAGGGTMLLPIFAVAQSSEAYDVVAGMPQNQGGQYIFTSSTFTTDSADGYPVMQM